MTERPFHIALITTFPPARCGIGNYARELVSSLRRIPASGGALCRISVIAEKTSPSETVSRGDVTYVWDRKTRWVDDIFDFLKKERPDAVHFQHEESIFGQGAAFAGLVKRLAEEGMAVFVTLHSVYDDIPWADWIPGRWPASRFHRALSRWCKKIVVHQDIGMKDTLIRQGVDSAKIAVIPHGTPAFFPAGVEPSFDPRNKTVLFFGFIHPKKGLLTLIDAFPVVHAAVPSARLVIRGNPRRRNFLDALYVRKLKRAIQAGTRDGWLEFHPGHVDDGEVSSHFLSAGVVALPHRQSYGSSSGVLHMAYAAGKPFVCSRGHKFSSAQQDLTDHPELFPAAGDVRSWEKALITLLSDDALREKMARWSWKKGRETDWTVSAEKHKALYSCP